MPNLDNMFAFFHLGLPRPRVHEGCEPPSVLRVPTHANEGRGFRGFRLVGIDFSDMLIFKAEINRETRGQRLICISSPLSLPLSLFSSLTFLSFPHPFS
jgi:hypothetical protein